MTFQDNKGNGFSQVVQGSDSIEKASGETGNSKELLATSLEPSTLLLKPDAGSDVPGAVGKPSPLIQ